MNASSSDHLGFFARWFELLAKHKLGAALLPVSGIPIGIVLVLSVRVLVEPFARYVGFFGTTMIGVCVLLFLIFAIAYLIIWIRKNY